ncbi:MAG: BrnT family toxin [Cyanobacteria bacterium]|nr:BrnT family toxin [Cyanobacteriota bacterium]
MLEFDPAKDRQNIRKHGISLARFADMDEESYLSARDEREYDSEERWIFFGLIDATLYCAVITYRDDRYRVISLRRATKRERQHYGETKEEQ